MSTEIAITSERICYLHCNFCNTGLAVSVPCNSMSRMVTVRCGHCATLLSVNMGALLHTLPPQEPQKQSSCEDGIKDSGSSSKCCYKFVASAAESVEQQPRIPPIRPPAEKRQRVPSAYNRFIKDEIQRIKARNPDLSHREAFSTASKNWAHFPHIHLGLTRESNKQAKVDHTMTSGGTQRSRPS